MDTPLTLEDIGHLYYDLNTILRLLREGNLHKIGASKTSFDNWEEQLILHIDTVCKIKKTFIELSKELGVNLDREELIRGS